MDPVEILLVEDDAVASRLIFDALASGGYRVRVCNSVGRALEQLSVQRPDLLLLDYQLPDGTASTLIDSLQQQGAGLPPFVVMTGAGDERLAVAMMKRGARDYLVKDANYAGTLPLVVARALAQAQMERQLDEARMALAASESRHRLLFENLTSGFALHEIICNHQGKPVDYRFLEVNPAFERLTGLVAAEIIGRTVREVLPATENFWIETYGAVALGGESVAFEHYSRATERHYEVRCYAPQPRQFAVVFDDITEQVLQREERLRAELGLRHSQQRLLQAQELGKIASFEWDLASGAIDWTPQGFALLEREPGTFEQSIAQWMEFVHPDDRPVLQQAIERVLAGKDSRVEYRLLMPDGRCKPVITIGDVKRSEDGVPVAIFGVSQDLSERKAIEDSLAVARDRAEAANRAKSEFLANMSHELRTPLNGVLGMLQLLETTRLDGEQHEYVRTATASGWSLLSLLNDILDLSRVEAGRLELRVEPFDIRELIDYCLLFFRQSAEEKRLALGKQVAATVPTVLQGDVVRLRQILFNLIGNAIKFTEQGGVRIEVALLGHPAPGRVTLRLRVADSGIGIGADMLQRVCEPFAQEEGPYQRRYQGAGLGLAIVRRLAELMQGEVTIASRSGEGTEVSVSLELGCEETLELPVGVQPGLPVQPAAAGSGLRLLVAEDNPVNRKTIVTLLQKAGHQVVAVGNGHELLEVLSQQPFDLLLLDVQMPGMDGLEALRRIRSDRSGRFDPRIPVVGVTAFTMAGDRETFLAAGMNACLDKPLHWRELEETLYRLIPPSRKSSPDRTTSVVPPRSN